jgi:hypothetical protein
MKILPVEATFFPRILTDGWTVRHTDPQTDMMKPKVVFCNFANATKKPCTVKTRVI